MGADADAESKPPRVGVALPDGELRRQLLRELEQGEVEIERLPPDADILHHLGRECVDVLVVRRTQFSSEARKELAELDGRAPGVVVLSRGETHVERVELVVSGVSQVLDATAAPAELAAAVETIAGAEQMGGRDGPEGRSAPAQPRLVDFLSRSPHMRRFLDVVQRVADADASLLITGETGSGKERLARAIHAESHRAEGPFVAINCGALPEHLLESELFGHEKGAFTGAQGQRRGHFEEAHGGTVFLDEIGEMPPRMQVKLLTVLQRKEIVRVGGSRPVRIDVRVIAATHRDVEALVKEGRFREDLYYRVNVVRLDVPPLRERLEDLPELVGFLIHHFREAMPESQVLGIEPDALEAILAHSWPGNVRELINAIEHAMLLTEGAQIPVSALPEGVLVSRGARPAMPAAPRVETLLPQDWRTQSIREVRERAIEGCERAYLRALLEETCGRIQETAERAGISSRALYDKLRRYGLEKEDFRR